MIVDFHTHNFPDALAKRAIDGMLKLLNGCLYPVGDGTLARQIADMKQDGVTHAVMCPVATKPEQADVIVRRAREIRDGACGEDAAKMIIPFASLHPADADLNKHLDLILAAGLKGVKLHPFYQRFALEDPRMIPFFASIRDAGLVIVCHGGMDPGYLEHPIECGPRHIATLMRNVPGLGPQFVAAHLGGFSGAEPGEVDRLLDTGCWLDTAVLESDQPKDEPRRIVREWPADRLLFGTDYYWTGERQLIDWVKANRPNPADSELIFHGNAERLLGLSPR